MSQLKRWAATGLGLALLTKDRAEVLVQDMVKQGEISRDEGKELLDNLLQRAQSERDELERRIDAEVRRVVKGTGLVSQEDLRHLEDKVRHLEQRLELLEGGSSTDQAPGTPAEGDGSSEQEPGSGQGAG